MFLEIKLFYIDKHKLLLTSYYILIFIKFILLITILSDQL